MSYYCPINEKQNFDWSNKKKEGKKKMRKREKFYIVVRNNARTWDVHYVL